MARLNSILALALLCCVTVPAAAQHISSGPIMRTIAAAGGGGFTANTAVFDGTSDYMEKITPMTGVTDAKTVTVSFWIKFDSGDGQQRYIYTMGSGSSDKFRVIRTTGNKIGLTGIAPAGTTVLTATSGTSVTVASGWTHVYIAIDLANSANRHIYFNGSEDGSVTWTTYTDSLMDLDPGTDAFYVGSDLGTGNKLSAALAELWFNDSYFNDTTKFISGGDPISLGANGQTPTGSAPALYLSLNGSGNSWATDSSGNGNNFTVGGTLGTTTPP
jgi:hypothetical protein